MPYASDKQRRFMHARHPEIAQKWDAEENKNKKRAAVAGAAAAGGGTAAAGTLIPVKASKMTGAEAAVHAKLRREHETHLTPHEFANASGGRGGRVQNNAYTARLAEAKREGKVPQGHTTLQVWNNTVTGLDGAHRGHASAMLGDNVHVQTVQHNKDKKYAGLLQRTITERKIRSQRKRVAQHANMGEEKVARLSGRYNDKISGGLNRWKSVSEHNFGRSVLPAATITAASVGAALGAKKVTDRKKVAKGMKLSDIAKAMNNDDKRSSVNRGLGGALVGTGLVAGGIPGKTSKKPSVSGGIFGYREAAHKKFLAGREAEQAAHNYQTTRLNHYLRGVSSGAIKPEKKIIPHLGKGRLVANAATVGGGALLYNEHRKNNQRAIANYIAKVDTGDPNARRRGSLVVGGTALAGIGAGTARALEHQGRKWSNEAQRSMREAEKVHPGVSGYTVQRGRTKVPHVKPTLRHHDLVANEPVKLYGASEAAGEKLGMLHGQAKQQNYIGRVYGNSAKTLRRATVGGGAAAAGVGGAAMLLNRRRKKKELSKSLVMKSEAAGYGHVSKARALIGGSNVAGYGYAFLPENIRNDVDSGSIAARRNPMSALDIYAASRTMADAQTGGRLSKWRLNRRTAREYNYAGGRAMLYSPTGRGAIF